MGVSMGPHQCCGGMSSACPRRAACAETAGPLDGSIYQMLRSIVYIDTPCLHATGGNPKSNRCR